MTSVRAAATAFFAVDGFVFATWAVRIPAVKAATHASPAVLGLALLGLSGGAIATMTISGALCRRFGAGRMTVGSAILLLFALLLPPLARSAPALALALLVFGAAYGSLNVSMNSLAISVVAALRRPVMPSFHAAWSFGGLAGAALGGLLAPYLAPLPHYALVCAAGLAVTAWCGRTLLTHPLAAAGAVTGELPDPREGAGGEGTIADSSASPGSSASPASSATPTSGASPASNASPGSRANRDSGTGRRGRAGRRGPGRGWRVVLLFGLIALCSAYGEGAIGDWGALAEACGRLAGSWLLVRLGQTRVLVLGGLTACAGMLAAALAPSIPVVLAGFALTGLGVANMFPAAMTRAGLVAGPNGVAAASTLGYGGFLLGPPTIGFLAAAVGLSTGLTTVSVLALVAALLAWIAGS
jgi:MFS family permease